ncbi:MAG TPA: S8 family serine peptidase, partial [Saprospiraceae bacterium]|nr:S8 family serine peptidase [Saprospiraceae bacterium]
MRLPTFFLLLLLAAAASAQPARSAGISPRCSAALLADSLRQAQTSQPQVYTLQVSDLATFQAWAEGQPLRLLSVYAPARVVAIQAAPQVFWEKVLKQPDVLSADRGGLCGKEELAVPGHNLFVNRIQSARARWPRYDGSGITASVKEHRFDSTDVDFLGRYLPSLDAPLPLQLHPHLMASLIGGGGNSDPAGRGAAPGVLLTSSSFLGLLPDPDAHYTKQQIGVQNHSYGSDIENYYGPSAAAYDHSVQEHPQLLHVFSAGNQGAAYATVGPYASIPGFANLSGSFKMAKNALVVGAVDSFGQWLPFSSRGPAHDGRLKPDLVAFGPTGSSEAAALSTGAAAVLQQMLTEKSTFQPPACALRAILIHSADDLPPAGPDFLSGYGSLNLKNALRIAEGWPWARAEIEAGDTLRFYFDLPPDLSQLRITLAWDDPPATPGASPALLHDLDLALLAPDGSRWLPWVLNTAPHADSLSQAAHRGRDSLNTVEQQLLPKPAAGLYELPVVARGNWSGTQEFVLVYSWDSSNYFEWDCPMRNDPAISGQEAILRWTAHLPADSGRVEWKAVGSTSWHTIREAVDLRAGYCRWLV